MLHWLLGRGSFSQPSHPPTPTTSVNKSIKPAPKQQYHNIIRNGILNINNNTLIPSQQMTQLSPTSIYKHYIPTMTQLSPNMTNIFAHTT